MTIRTWLIFSFVSLFVISSCSSNNDNNKMFVEKVHNLINANTEEQEELALGELLTVAKQTNINYGYKVFNISKNKQVLPNELEGRLDSELEVTILVGDEPPYQEFKWKPKYNGHITRLIVP